MGTKLSTARSFAMKAHRGQTKKDGTKVTAHLHDVILKLTNLGITDEKILAAAWLHDVLEECDTSPQKLEKIFGKNITSLVLSLTKNTLLSKKQRDSQYIRQLKNAPLEAKLIKLCDIASNLEKIQASDLSVAYKAKTTRRLAAYFFAIKNPVLKMQTTHPSIKKLVGNINSILKIY